MYANQSYAMKLTRLERSRIFSSISSHVRFFYAKVTGKNRVALEKKHKIEALADMFIGSNGVELTVEEWKDVCGFLRMSDRKGNDTLLTKLAPLTVYTPKVGVPCTEAVGSDRYPYTIVRVSKTGKTFWMKPVEYKRVDQNGMSECQDYEYGNVINRAQEYKVVRTKRGWKVVHGCSVFVGAHCAYYDPHF